VLKLLHDPAATVVSGLELSVALQDRVSFAAACFFAYSPACCLTCCRDLLPDHNQHSFFDAVFGAQAFQFIRFSNYVCCCSLSLYHILLLHLPAG
jgi:hypothetical protein